MHVLAYTHSPPRTKHTTTQYIYAMYIYTQSHVFYPSHLLWIWLRRSWLSCTHQHQQWYENLCVLPRVVLVLVILV